MVATRGIGQHAPLEPPLSMRIIQSPLVCSSAHSCRRLAQRLVDSMGLSDSPVETLKQAVGNTAARCMRSGDAVVNEAQRLLTPAWLLWKQQHLRQTPGSSSTVTFSGAALSHEVAVHMRAASGKLPLPTLQDALHPRRS